MSPDGNLKTCELTAVLLLIEERSAENNTNKLTDKIQAIKIFCKHVKNNKEKHVTERAGNKPATESKEEKKREGQREKYRKRDRWRERRNTNKNKINHERTK